MNKQQYILWAMALLFFCCGTSCSLIDQEEALPVYLQLNQSKIFIDSTIDTTSTFSSVAGLKDLWIDHNGFPFGVHRLPRTIPLLMENSNRLTFSGGIFENGLSSIRSRYPFWVPISVNLDAMPLDTIPYQFTFSYYPDSVLAYPFYERFEEGTISLRATMSGANQTNLTITSRESFEGNFAGRVRFEANAHNFEAIANSFIPLPQTGNNDLYMEISYKNNIPFTAGLLYVTTNGTGVGDLNNGLVYQSDTWNTVYIHINDLVRSIGSNALFKPYIRASSLNASTGEAQVGEIILDNIRIIHFK